MASHSSIVAWKIPWTEEPRGLQSIESPGDLPGPGTEPESPELARALFTTEPAGKPNVSL